MARYKPTLTFAGSLEVETQEPLDARTVVPTKADLTVAGNFPYAYKGLPVYVEAEQKVYVLTDLDTTEINNWKEVGSGEGNTVSVELTQAQYDALSDDEKNNGTVYFIIDGQGGGSIPIATPTTLGGVKVGAGLQVQTDGTLSADGSGGGAVPDGGTLGQALVKKSNSNQDLEWKAIGVQTLNDNVSTDGKWTWKFYEDRTFELWYMAWGIEHTIDTPVGSLFKGDQINLTWPTEFNPRNKSITYHYVGVWFQVPNKLVWPVNSSTFHTGVGFIPLSVEALSPANNCIIRAYIKGKLAE